MSEASRPAFLELSYRNPTHPTLGIEAFKLSELRRRMPASFFKRIQRPRFHLMALYIEGQGVQEIDFVTRRCQPGTLLHVHPGQVVRYLAVENAEAHLILFEPEFVWAEGGALADTIETGASLEVASYVPLSDSAYAAARALFEAVEREYASTDAGSTSESIMRHLLMALLLHIGRAAANHRMPEEVPPHQREVFMRLRRELEKSYKRTRKVQDYADSLGYSTRTLNRATLSLVGVPAKTFVDHRVALEAKRLLAHTSLSVAETARELGFTEATNFVKFFRRETGTQPGTFRDTYKHH